MSAIKQRAVGHAQDDEITTEYDPLAVLDEPAGSAEPLDNAEQQAIMAQLQASNDKSNKVARAAMLFLLSLVLVTYATPIPAYIAGTHPENHLTLFWAGTHTGPGSTDDLVYLPAGPIYGFFLFLQGILIVGALREAADQLGIIKGGPAATAFPAQPHLYGTAPNWLIPSLQDIRFSAQQSSGQVNKRADGTVVQPKGLSALPPRPTYLLVLFVASLPMPLMVFGAGNFTNAAWWSFATAALGINFFVEWSIANSEKELRGLDGQRYNYKGA
ncbi:unnamed protein product [Parajaminaea phylloscopi]